MLRCVRRKVRTPNEVEHGAAETRPHEFDELWQRRLALVREIVDVPTTKTPRRGLRFANETDGLGVLQMSYMRDFETLTSARLHKELHPIRQAGF